MSDISSKAKKILQGYSKKAKVSIKEIEKKYLETLVKEKEGYPDLSQEDLEERVLLILQGDYSSRKRSKATLQQGFFIGDTFARDRNAFLRNKATTVKNRSFPEAKMLGLVNDAGEVLDNRPMIKLFGKEIKNPNYNNPLKEEWSRRIYGIFKYKNNWIFGLLNLRGDRALYQTVEYFKPCQFLAMDRGVKTGYLTLNESSFTDFQEINSDWNIHQIFMDLFNNEILQIDSDILERELLNTKDSWDGYSLVVGTVQKPIIQGQRTTVINLSNSSPEVWTETPLTCFVPVEWDIDFVEYSKIIALGKLAESKARRFSQTEEEPETKIVMRVYGIYSLPGYTRIAKNIKDMKTKDVKFVWKSLEG